MNSGNAEDETDNTTMTRYGDEYYVGGGEPPQQTSLVNLDRDRGILTPADRQLLVGVSNIESESNSERKARQRIRERIRDAMRDYYLLLNYLDERDLNQTFGQQKDSGWTVFDDVISVFPAAIGFLYAGTIADPENTVETFENRVSSGIAAAEKARNDQLVSVEVDIEVTERRDVDKLVTIAEEEGAAAEEITPEAMNALFTSGDVDKELYADIMEDLLQESPTTEWGDIADK